MITRRDFIKVAAAGGALATLGDMPEAKAAVKTIVPDPAYCYESEKKIPVIAEVDLVVVGGSSATRPRAAAPACGSMHMHNEQLQDLLATAFGKK